MGARVGPGHPTPRGPGAASKCGSGCVGSAPLFVDQSWDNFALVGPANEGSRQTPFGNCNLGDLESASADTGRDDSVVRGLQVGDDECTTLVRCSPRLALKDSSTVLEAAVARKARLQDCGTSRAGPRKRLSHKKLIGISRLCGVKLRGGEADSLMEFVSLDL